jgi:hypothetical protein
VNRLSDDATLECRICWYVYNPDLGDDVQQIPADTSRNTISAAPGLLALPPM